MRLQPRRSKNIPLADYTRDIRRAKAYTAQVNGRMLARYPLQRGDHKAAREFTRTENNYANTIYPSLWFRLFGRRKRR